MEETQSAAFRAITGRAAIRLFNFKYVIFVLIIILQIYIIILFICLECLLKCDTYFQKYRFPLYF